MIRGMRTRTHVGFSNQQIRTYFHKIKKAKKKPTG